MLDFRYSAPNKLVADGAGVLGLIARVNKERRNGLFIRCIGEPLEPSLAMLIEEAVKSGYILAIEDDGSETLHLENKGKDILQSADLYPILKNINKEDADSKYAAEAWAFILLNGGENQFMGSIYKEWNYSDSSLPHILACGIDIQRSVVPRVTSWDTFEDTFSEEDHYEPVFGGIAYCNCSEIEGVHVGTSLSESSISAVVKDLAKKRR